MAHTVATREGSTHTKKLLSQLVFAVNDETKAKFSAAGNYLVARLPEDCIVQNAYVFTTVAGVGNVTVGTTEGGTEILSLGDIAVLDDSGTFTGASHTGTGKDVFVALPAITTAEYFVVVEYLELYVDTGSLTRV